MPGAKRNAFAVGWLPSAALAPVAPTASTTQASWIGTWKHPHGAIEITRSVFHGRLQIEGFMLVPRVQGFHNGEISAQVLPEKNSITFDGWMRFGVVEDYCKVRMRRVGPYLLVEDNRDCGGVGVSFTGLYRRR